MRYMKVKDNQGLVRDVNSNAILNVNSNDIQKAKNAKKARKNQASEVQQLKNDVTELKAMMREILDRL